MYIKWSTALTALSLSIHQTYAQISLDITSDDSIKAAAKVAAANMMTYYTGNQPGQIPGLLPGPYYWWEAGAMFGQLINYWKLTGDSQYNDIVTQALLFQTGENENYMPSNQTKSLGNDDQAFWALSVLDAAEAGFPNPPDKYPSWVSLAQAVWNTQFVRWDNATCNGGLRWQIFNFNGGYNYKNAIANGGFFQISARLYRYTGNITYAAYAEETWDWMYNSPIMDRSLEPGQTPVVWDGVSTNNCSDVTQLHWSYNVGTLLVGAAYMANASGNATWSQRATQLMQATDIFFVKDAGGNTGLTVPDSLLGGTIMSEIACEASTTCNYDQPSFKAYLSRWMAVTGQLVPSLASEIYSRLSASATSAVRQCTGNAMGRTTMCGRRWYQSVWDGQYGVGEQMSAMSVFQNLLINKAAAPLTDHTGGTSQSNPTFGLGSGQGSGLIDPYADHPITTGDRAGAGILTFLSLVLAGAGTAFMMS